MTVNDGLPRRGDDDLDPSEREPIGREPLQREPRQRDPVDRDAVRDLPSDVSSGDGVGTDGSLESHAQPDRRSD
ncbi:MAG: hypothetical protein GEV28_18125 [Actinophytocola sp.]|uniref:hypothetical protein n=1 Tax=Actinophytocola sp. TaxID=1872138 RepID=UPI0013269BD3|nr:hypothetical protein [Actinophytocola sp.]MPZ82205.1 hypothetical protein [Actinophytocola sp.]